MDVSKIKPLLDIVAQLEPPVLGKRLDDLEQCIRLLNKQISQLRCDFVELREWVILDQAGKK
jgi:hypothetical protein